MRMAPSELWVLWASVGFPHSECEVLVCGGKNPGSTRNRKLLKSLGRGKLFSPEANSDVFGRSVSQTTSPLPGERVATLVHSQSNVSVDSDHGNERAFILASKIAHLRIYFDEEPGDGETAKISRKNKLPDAITKYCPPLQFPEPILSVAGKKSPSALAREFEYLVVTGSARKVFRIGFEFYVRFGEL